MKKPATRKKTKATKKRAAKGAPKIVRGEASPSRLIDARIRDLGDWRAETLARVRAIITKADAGVTEEWKWGGPVWSHPRCGVICTGETYKTAVKMTFAKGASLDDPSGLFTSSLEGATRRAIDIHEGDTIDAKALKALVRAAVALGKPS